MPLTLSIRNVAQFSNGSAVSLVLDRRGAMIGRAATTDWCLPDPSLHLSSRHCEVRYSGDLYELIDHSTNGTFLFGQATRLSAPHVIRPGDIFVVGQYEIVAALDDASAAAAGQRNASAAEPQWQGWGAAGNAEEAAPSANLSAWGRPPDQAAISGSGPLSQSWTPPAIASEPSAPASAWGAPQPAAPPTPPPAAPAQSPWGAAPETPSSAPAWEAPAAQSPWNTAPAQPPAQPASEWSSGPAPATPPTGNDIWGDFAQSNVVDWARGGFGTPPAAPLAAVAPLAAAAPLAVPVPVSASASAPMAAPQTTVPPPQSALPPVAAPVAPPASPPQIAPLLAAAGIDPAQIKRNDTELSAQAGTMLRQLVAGLVVMLEARARAKSQLGAQGTNLEFDGNNPLKFARAPEQALVQMLNPPERGFMGSDRAIEDAFRDLQAHQVATLKAMQGALRATLDRFSPGAIRARAEKGGILRKILPGARDAALWAAYEKEFQGVAVGSDEAFMDMFAKEFRIAYEELSARR